MTASSISPTSSCIAPKLRLSGAGQRNRDGTFHIVASGRQSKYGTLRMILDGHIERPRVDLFFDRPNDPMGLKDMRLLLLPTAAGFDYTSSGSVAARAVHQQAGRSCCPAAAARPSPSPRSMSAARRRAAICAPTRAASPARWRWPAAASTANSLSRRSATRRRSKRICGPAASAFPASSRSARAGSTAPSCWPTSAPRSTAWSTRAGSRRAASRFARLTANARLVNGSGQVRAAIAGRRGAAFDFTTLANVTPDSIQLTGRGADRAAAAGACGRRRC